MAEALHALCDWSAFPLLLLLLLLLPPPPPPPVCMYCSAVLVLVGLFIRIKVEETPAFSRAVRLQQTVRIPFFEVSTIRDQQSQPTKLAHFLDAPDSPLLLHWCGWWQALVAGLSDFITLLPCVTYIILPRIWHSDLEKGA